MFILYAIPIGLALGRLFGGRLEDIGTVRFRFGALAVIALAIQIVLFSPLADDLPTDFGRGLYIASTAVVAGVVLANVRLTGLALIFVGAASNLAAIAANGGQMPAEPGALAAVGLNVGGNSNSAVPDQVALRPLTDVFALPAWLPFTNVFSVGDVLIGVGVAVAIAAAMRSAAPEQPPDQTVPPGA